MCSSVRLYVMRACVRVHSRLREHGEPAPPNIWNVSVYPRVPLFRVLSSLREVIGGFLEAVSVFTGEP